MFQTFRRILCICPCCGNILRFSDLRLSAKGKAVNTWLDTYESKIMSLDNKEAKFDEKEKQLREQSAERGRKKVPKIVNRSLDEKFLKLKYNPYDVKAILHPVDFVVFNGMEDNDIKDIVLLSKNSSNSNINAARSSVKFVVSKCLYDWKVARIDGDGKINME